MPHSLSDLSYLSVCKRLFDKILKSGVVERTVTQTKKDQICQGKNTDKELVKDLLLIYKLQ